MKNTGKTKFAWLKNNDADITFISLAMYIGLFLLASAILLFISLYIMIYNVKSKVNTVTNDFMTEMKCDYYDSIKDTDFNKQSADHNAPDNQYYRDEQVRKLIRLLTTRLNGRYENKLIISDEPDCRLSNISMKYENSVLNISFNLEMNFNVFGREKTFYKSTLTYQTVIEKKEYK